MTDLRFKDGKFRILCFSDSHGIKDFETRVVRDIEAITEGTSPDLVLFLGDNNLGVPRAGNKESEIIDLGR